VTFNIIFMSARHFWISSFVFLSFSTLVLFQIPLSICFILQTIKSLSIWNWRVTRMDNASSKRALYFVVPVVKTTPSTLVLCGLSVIGDTLITGFWHGVPAPVGNCTEEWELVWIPGDIFTWEVLLETDTFRLELAVVTTAVPFTVRKRESVFYIK